MPTEYTINGKSITEVSKEEAIDFCYKNKDKYISDCGDGIEEGTRQFDCLITILEEETISPSAIPEYGMSDQGLSLTNNFNQRHLTSFEDCVAFIRGLDEAQFKQLCDMVKEFEIGFEEDK